MLERSELIALDAAEAYVDVTRYTRIVALAEQNLQVHLELRKNVRARFAGGRAGEGDTQQAEERVAALKQPLPISVLVSTPRSEVPQDRRTRA